MAVIVVRTKECETLDDGKRKEATEVVLYGNMEIFRRERALDVLISSAHQISPSKARSSDYQLNSGIVRGALQRNFRSSPRYQETNCCLLLSQAVSRAISIMDADMVHSISLQRRDYDMLLLLRKICLLKSRDKPALSILG